MQLMTRNTRPENLQGQKNLKESSENCEGCLKEKENEHRVKRGM